MCKIFLPGTLYFTKVGFTCNEVLVAEYKRRLCCAGNLGSRTSGGSRDRLQPFCRIHLLRRCALQRVETRIRRLHCFFLFCQFSNGEPPKAGFDLTRDSSFCRTIHCVACITGLCRQISPNLATRFILKQGFFARNLDQCRLLVIFRQHKIK